MWMLMRSAYTAESSGPCFKFRVVAGSVIALIDRNRQRFETAQKIRSFVGRFHCGIFKSEPRETLEHRLERDASLHPCQRRADAEVNPLTERDVFIGIARDVEFFRILELRRVAIRRRYDHPRPCA